MEPIESAYFNWLCAKVIQTNLSVYRELMRILHKTEYVWVLSGDDNRAADGIELRDYFLNETHYENDPGWYNEPCSVLEVLIAFAGRASFQTDMPVRDWFWIFLKNLRLDDYRQVAPEDRRVIEEILSNFVWRNYDFDGIGGLFPLSSPTQDQREVEIWYQWCFWVKEQGLI